LNVACKLSFLLISFYIWNIPTSCQPIWWECKISLKMTRIKIICNKMKFYTKWKCLKTFNLPPSISLYSNIIFLSHFEFLQAHNLTFKYALSYGMEEAFLHNHFLLCFKTVRNKSYKLFSDFKMNVAHFLNELLAFCANFSLFKNLPNYFWDFKIIFCKTLSKIFQNLNLKKIILFGQPKH